MSKDATQVKVQSHKHNTDLWTDTETIVRFNGETVYVRVNCLPGLVRWTCPPAAITRKWVDEILEGTGKKRTGSRVSRGGWTYTYYLTDKD